SEILNKPVEYNLKAGNNITITKSGNDVTISSTGGGGGGGTTYSSGLGIDITNDVISVNSDVALASAIPVVTGFATKTELAAVTATIPEIELNSDSQVTAIDGHALAAGSNYTAGTGISIDANDVISVTGMATEVELQTVSAAIPNELSGASGILIEDDTVSLDEPLEIVAGSGVTFSQEGDTITISADIPEEISLVAGQNISIAVTGASAVISSTGGGSSQQVQADWTETDTSDPSYIQNKPDLSNYATQSYVQGYTVPVEVVATSAAATGTNVLYIVTG
ncbi:MAG: hypothetical protein IIZ78_21735, partial [Clostridiales bacterium]|nr:hypothetical protein [Clostridiales bacterium]